VSEYGVYEVTGKREYRGHNPGTVFEAFLDPPLSSARSTAATSVCCDASHQI
jgi:hypothetical protein